MQENSQTQSMLAVCNLDKEIQQDLFDNLVDPQLGSGVFRQMLAI